MMGGREGLQEMLGLLLEAAPCKKHGKKHQEICLEDGCETVLCRHKNCDHRGCLCANEE